MCHRGCVRAIERAFDRARVACAPVRNSVATVELSQWFMYMCFAAVRSVRVRGVGCATLARACPCARREPRETLSRVESRVSRVERVHCHLSIYVISSRRDLKQVSFVRGGVCLCTVSRGRVKRTADVCVLLLGPATDRTRGPWPWARLLAQACESCHRQTAHPRRSIVMVWIRTHAHRVCVVQRMSSTCRAHAA